MVVEKQKNAQFKVRMRKKKHWANVFAMFGVAMVATAYFQEGFPLWGYVLGILFIYISGKIAPED